MQHLYDPGVLPSSANQCISVLLLKSAVSKIHRWIQFTKKISVSFQLANGKVCLRSILSGRRQQKQTHAPFKAAKSHHQVPAAQWVCEMDQDAASAEQALLQRCAR